MVQHFEQFDTAREPEAAERANPTHTIPEAISHLSASVQSIVDLYDVLVEGNVPRDTTDKVAGLSASPPLATILADSPGQIHQHAERIDHLVGQFREVLFGGR